ncbi:MAG: sigma-70 family RNA polymerase sigma factor [bacterium]|nr:sigma-70 family RNA polymerase sigma factor [bacterium]
MRMDSNTKLEQLILGSCKYDHDAFRSIFDLYVDQLFNYALSRTNDREAAKDITQDTFIAIWESLDSFEYKGDAAFLGFMFVILKRKIGGHYKKSAKERSVRQEVIIEPHTADSDETHDLLLALRNLSSKYQEVLKLRYWGDLSFAEIGETLGIQENAARILHYRAIKKLQKVGEV